MATQRTARASSFIRHVALWAGILLVAISTRPVHAQPDLLPHRPWVKMQTQSSDSRTSAS